MDFVLSPRTRHEETSRSKQPRNSVWRCWRFHWSLRSFCLKVCWKMDGTENSEDTFLFNCKNANCMNCSLFFRSEEEYFWGTLKHPKHPESCQTWRWTNQVTKPPKKKENLSQLRRLIELFALSKFGGFKSVSVKYVFVKNIWLERLQRWLRHSQVCEQHQPQSRPASVNLKYEIVWISSQLDKLRKIETI